MPTTWDIWILTATYGSTNQNRPSNGSFGLARKVLAKVAQKPKVPGSIHLDSCLALYLSSCLSVNLYIYIYTQYVHLHRHIHLHLHVLIITYIAKTMDLRP